ncbi:MAG: hypothetical protein HXY34_09445 [Candidatus Thorarchaeota archaeon]|nr:hypothetical protein [Candidatus Thorarchaeota archaeon]
MTEAEPVEQLVPRIVEQYNRQPRGWRVLHTPAGDMLVIGPESAFQLRLIALSPFQFTGAGVEISTQDPSLAEVRNTPEFGLRPLDERDIERFMSVIQSPEAALPMIEEIVKREPVAPAEIEREKVRHLLSGPVLTRPDLTSFSPDTLKLQRQLEASAHEVFRKRHSMRAGIYY